MRSYFATAFPSLDWQPSDVHPDALASIEAWREAAELPNLRSAVHLDAANAHWPIARANAILSINMVHISPWASALGLLDGAERLLGGEGVLILYGPWLTAEAAAPSNLEFDADLKTCDPDWGLRKVEDFAAAANDRGFKLEATRTMPANNLMLLLRPNRTNQ